MMFNTTRWRVALNVPVFHQSLDYRRGGIDTLMHGTWVYFRPDASFRHIVGSTESTIFVSAPVTNVLLGGYTEPKEELPPRQPTACVLRREILTWRGRPRQVPMSIMPGNTGRTSAYGMRARPFNCRHRDVAQLSELQSV